MPSRVSFHSMTSDPGVHASGWGQGSKSSTGGGGRTGLMVRASDSGSGDPGSILGRVGVFVSLSKRHLLPKSTGNTQE